MSPLQVTADRQSVWSATANQLKAALDHTRWITFGLSIVGALCATIAGQIAGDRRWWFAMGGAVLLALGTFLTRRLMGQDNVLAWTRARAASEALKREAYKFAAHAAPYDGDDPARVALLNEEREKIEEAVDELINRAVTPSAGGSPPTADISPDEYIERRVNRQINGFYEPKAEKYRRIAAGLGWAEFGLAFTATVIATVTGATEKGDVQARFFGLDLIALTAVLTTVAGAIVAHVEASRYDFLVMTYRATARRLRNEMTRAGIFTAPSPEWSAFVNRCEAIIADENSNWLAKWTK